MAECEGDEPHTHRDARSGGTAVIDIRRDKFPYAIVWTPIPCLTWFLPFVGHMVRTGLPCPFLCVRAP